jgi:hypothetical protein
VLAYAGGHADESRAQCGAHRRFEIRTGGVMSAGHDEDAVRTAAIEFGCKDFSPRTAIEDRFLLRRATDAAHITGIHAKVSCVPVKMGY